MDLSSFDISPLTLVGMVAIVGLYFGFLARKAKLPSLIGFMVLGVILGPSVLHLVGESTMEHLSFVTEVALGFVAFSIGAELSLSSLKRLGIGIVSIIFAESFAAFFIVAGLIYFFWRDPVLALIFGAMAPASAPAGTVAVIQEYKAKGNLTKALYAVVGFDDGLAIIIFGFAFAIAKTLLGAADGEEASIMSMVIVPIKEIALSLALGGGIGLVFCQLVRKLQSSRDMFIVVFGCVLLATGLSLRWHLSLILTNMVVGFVLVNTRRSSLVHRVTQPLLEVMPLLFILFFTLAGAHLKLAALSSLGAVGIVYIVGRSSGKLFGAWFGAVVGKVESKLRKYVGMGILSQAGVAIGLSLIVQHELSQMGHAELGSNVLTTITATCIFFEIIGPILAKVALSRAGEIPKQP